MLLPLKIFMFSSKDNQVSDRRKSCGRPNILSRAFAFRTSVASVRRAGNKVFGFIATAAAALVIYILMAFPLDSGEAILALLISLLSSSLMAGFLPFDLRLLNPVRVIKALIYLPFFFRKMLQANISIAAVVLQPKLPIKPAIIKEETALSSAEGRLILTSSITLTPGTLSVDIDDHTLFIHCVLKTGKKVLEPFEKHIRGISE